MKAGANLAPTWCFWLFFDVEGNRVKLNLTLYCIIYFQAHMICKVLHTPPDRYVGVNNHVEIIFQWLFTPTYYLSKH